jgi:hypothetical protein
MPAGFPLGGSSRTALPQEAQQMPLWMEVLLNVVAYAGFVAIATYHKPSGDDLPTDKR